MLMYLTLEESYSLNSKIAGGGSRSSRTHEVLIYRCASSSTEFGCDSEAATDVSAMGVGQKPSRLKAPRTNPSQVKRPQVKIHHRLF